MGTTSPNHHRICPVKDNRGRGMVEVALVTMAYGFVILIVIFFWLSLRGLKKKPARADHLEVGGGGEAIVSEVIFISPLRCRQNSF
jgi:hypothetical protein